MKQLTKIHPFAKRNILPMLLLMVFFSAHWVWAQPISRPTDADRQGTRNAVNDYIQRVDPFIFNCNGMDFEIRRLPDEAEDGRCCYELIIKNATDEVMEWDGTLEMQFMGTGVIGTAADDFILDGSFGAEKLYFLHESVYYSPEFVIMNIQPGEEITIGKMCVDADMINQVGVTVGPLYRFCMLSVELPKCENTCCNQFEIQIRNMRSCPGAPCLVDLYIIQKGAGEKEGGAPCNNVESIKIGSNDTFDQHLPFDNWRPIAVDYEFDMEQTSITVQVKMRDGKTCEIEVHNPCK